MHENTAQKLIYKYLSPDRLDVLENAAVRFTQPDQLNDPFESRPCMQSVRDCFHAKLVEQHPKQSPEKIEGLLNKTIKNLQAMLGKSTAVLSLSKNCDNQLMWSHYCDGHKGFVIGFDRESSFFSTKRVGPTEVQYSENRVNIPIDPNEPSTTFLASNEAFFLTKSKDWDYEEEIRVLADAQNPDKSKIVNGDNILLYQFPRSSIRKVILGCRSHPNFTSSITTLVRSHYPSVEMRRARLNELTFKVDIVPEQ